MTGLESLISEMEKDEKFCLGDTTSRRRWIDMARRLAAEEQELYRENQRLQCEIDRLSRHPASEQKAPSADRTEELVKRLRELRDTISKLGYDDDTEDSLNRIIADLEKGARAQKGGR